jgi:hypothetical protein
MKYLPIIAFTVAMYFVMSKVSNTNWNIGIYSLFVIGLSYELIVNLRKLYKIRRSQTCEGLITAYTKQKPEDLEEVNYNIDVRFISPLDNKSYIIKSTIKYLPNDNLVDVIFDEANPDNSKAYSKFKITDLWVVLPLVFFVNQLLQLLF